MTTQYPGLSVICLVLMQLNGPAVGTEERRGLATSLDQDAEVDPQVRHQSVLDRIGLVTSDFLAGIAYSASPDPAYYLNETLSIARDAVQQGQDPRALEAFLQAQELARDAPPPVRARIEYELGLTYRRLERYPDALEAYALGLELLEPAPQPKLQVDLLMAQGIVFQYLERYAEAARSFQQIIERQRVASPTSLVMAYGNLGSAHSFQGSYAKALVAYRQALATAQSITDVSPALLANIHTDIGMVLAELADYAAALKHFDIALGLVDVEAGVGQAARIDHHIGYTLYKRGEHLQRLEDIQASLEVYQRALSRRRQAGDRDGEGKTLNNMGFSLAKLGRNAEALEAMEAGLAIARERADRANEGRTLDSIATVYMQQGEYARALDHFHDALLIAREIGDRGAEFVTLANIGKIYNAERHARLAIVFLKRSVEVIEDIRRELETLPAAARRSYADSVAATYRLLADLLLAERRPLEAERVIDLLRVEELDDYLGGVRSGGSQVHRLPGEEAVWESYSSVLAASLARAQELAGLTKIRPAERTPEQKARIRDLRLEREVGLKAFRELADSAAIQAALQRRRLESQIEAVQLDMIPENLQYLGENEILFYPFVLEDRLELIFATAHGMPVNIPQPVTAQQLNDTIFAFRQALIGRTDEVETLGRQLYAWLLQPLEQALAQLDAPAEQAFDTLIYAPDGVLRYIPLPALHDGEDWLARKYRVNLITARSLPELGRTPGAIDEVLAGAYTLDRDDIDVAGDLRSFPGLPFARTEVEDLQSLYPRAHVHLDADFTPDNFVHVFEDYQLVHLATHGVFVPGRPPEDSFILFGDGRRASLSDIRDGWLLHNVEMVVLSACETGVGGVLGNGEEIHGFGYLMQKAGANAVIASLWEVSDGGTQALMSSFYRQLLQTGMGKAKALQQAQLAMIDNRFESEVIDAVRGARPVDQAAVPIDFAHPFYWAPFVLIGNGR